MYVLQIFLQIKNKTIESNDHYCSIQSPSIELLNKLSLWLHDFVYVTIFFNC
jgi:hypothetical protein